MIRYPHTQLPVTQNPEDYASITGHSIFGFLITGYRIMLWYPNIHFLETQNTDIVQYPDTRYPDFWTSIYQVWLDIRNLKIGYHCSVSIVVFLRRKGKTMKLSLFKFKYNLFVSSFKCLFYVWSLYYINYLFLLLNASFTSDHYTFVVYLW